MKPYDSDRHRKIYGAILSVGAMSSVQCRRCNVVDDNLKSDLFLAWQN